MNQLLNQSKNILWLTQAFVFACQMLKGDFIFLLLELEGSKIYK
jgi:hypothetical protein